MRADQTAAISTQGKEQRIQHSSQGKSSGQVGKAGSWESCSRVAKAEMRLGGWKIVCGGCEVMESTDHGLLSKRCGAVV